MTSPHLWLTSLADYIPVSTEVSRDYFEIFWYREWAGNAGQAPSSWLRLAAWSRASLTPPCGRQGQVLRFTYDYLDDNDKEFVVAVFKLFNQTGEPPLLALPTAQDEALRTLYNVLAQEYRESVPCFASLKALLKAFLLRLIRLRQDPLTLPDLQEKRVHQFMRLVELHYATQAQAAFYAEHLHLSTKRLNHILHTKLGRTATQFVHERRLLEAKRELALQERTIQEIGFGLGFEEPSYFARFFRKHTGLSPSAYQQQMVKIVSGIAPTGSG